MACGGTGRPLQALVGHIINRSAWRGCQDLPSARGRALMRVCGRSLPRGRLAVPAGEVRASRVPFGSCFSLGAACMSKAARKGAGTGARARSRAKISNSRPAARSQRVARRRRPRAVACDVPKGARGRAGWRLGRTRRRWEPQAYICVWRCCLASTRRVSALRRWCASGHAHRWRDGAAARHEARGLMEREQCCGVVPCVGV